MRPKRYKPKRRLKPRHSRLKKLGQSRFFWVGLLGLFMAGGVFYGVFFTPLFHITHIEIQGAEKVSAEKLREIAKEYIPKKFVFFQVSHLFLLNTSKAREEIQAAFPQVETVAVAAAFPNRVKITVKERRGIAVWCQEKSYTVEISEEERQRTRSFRQCFALDRTGVIFAEKELAQEVLISGENGEAVLGERVVDPSVLESILRFQQELDAFALFQEVGLRVSSWHIVSAERVIAKISEGWELYFNPAERVDWQIQKVKLVLEQEIPFQKRPFLEYIELRFGDQAYIRYRD